MMQIFVLLALFAIALATNSKEYASRNTEAQLRYPAYEMFVYNSKDEVMNAEHSPFKSTGSWVSYKQCDSRWSGQQLGTCNLTICNAGCAMSSVAMMLKTKGANVDPSSLDSWLTNNGGYANGCNIYWGSVNAFGVVTFIAMETASYDEICTGLNNMHGIVANVNNGGHWVLLTGCAGNGVYYVNDPGYSRDTYNHYEVLEEAVYH